MKKEREYFLNPLRIGNGLGPMGRNNDEILEARGGYYIASWKKMQAKAEEMKAEYGSWSQIPNKQRTWLANNLRYAGFIYNPTEGWVMPNSAALSSL